MSINSALQIGRSGLLAGSAATNVAGNNLANVATRNYHRQVISLVPTPDQKLEHGIFAGRGVQVAAIVRQVNEALESRLRNSLADQAGSAAQRTVLEQIEALNNELSDADLSTHLSTFFNTFSQLANMPLNGAVRNLVVQQGNTLGSFIRNRRDDFINLRTKIDSNLNDASAAANDLLQQIEAINQQIVRSAGGTGGAHALRDQRDTLFQQLSEFLDISTVKLNSGNIGAVDAYVDSLPIILNGQSRGLKIRQETVNDQIQIELVIAEDGSVLNPGSGQIAGLLRGRQDDLGQTIDTLNRFSNELIFQVNRLHSQGQGSIGFSAISGTTRVLDPTVVLTDSAAGLPFNVEHGSFEVHLTQKSNNQRVTTLLQVDLDGIGSDTTLNSLVADLNAIANVSASITSDGSLQLVTDASDLELSFGRDSSGVLAALGMNTFFAGNDATDIHINTTLLNDTHLVAAGQEHVSGDNRNALALAGLRSVPVDSLGLSLTDFWNNHIEDQAVRLGQLEQEFLSNTVVRENLEAQVQHVSGVNSDEEAINLLSFQRTFQASARFLTVVNEMIDTLLQLG